MPFSDQRFSLQLLTITLIAGLGGLLFGFDTAVIAGITDALTAVYHLSPLLLGVTVSSALWGTIIGAASAGWFSDRYGRRACLRVLALLYVLSATGCALTWGWAAGTLWRPIVRCSIFFPSSSWRRKRSCVFEDWCGSATKPANNCGSCSESVPAIKTKS